MRSLNLSYTLPYPPHSGYSLRVWNLCRELSGRVAQTLVCRVIGSPAASSMEACHSVFAAVHALDVARPSLARKAIMGARYLLMGQPVEAAGYDMAPVSERIRRLLSVQTFDLVVFDGLWLYPYWKLFEGTNLAKVVHLHDQESEALERWAAVMPPGFKRVLFRYDARRMAAMERRLLRKADLILVPSRREKEKLDHELPGLPVEITPNGVDAEALQPLPESGAREILFVGALSTLPNRDAVKFFVSDVWPGLRSRYPDLVFHVVGKSPPPEIARLDGVNGIRVAADVESVEPYYQRCALSIIPIRVGSGTRLKILESMALSRPVVSTSVGAEGLDVIDGEHLLIADTPRDLREKIASLLESPSRARALAQAGRRLVEAVYTWPTIAADLYRHFERVLSR